MKMFIQAKRKNLYTILPVLILIILFVISSFIIIDAKYNSQNELSSLKTDILLIDKISRFIHDVQIERGLSIGYIGTFGKKFSKDLKVKRKETDKKLYELKIFAQSHNINPHVKAALDKALKYFDYIVALRDGVDKMVAGIDNILKVYSTNNEYFLNVMIKVSEISNEPKITQNIIAYSNYLFYIENTGMERALGVGIISLKDFTQEKINGFNTVIVKEKVFRDLFLKYANKDIKNKYKTIIEKQNFNDIVHYRYVILSAQKVKIKELDIKYWFEIISHKINVLNKLSSFISNYILQQIDTIYRNNKTGLLWAVIFNFMALMVFIFAIYVIYSLIKTEDELKKLIDEYVITSVGDLNGRILDVSKAFCTVSGYEKEELIGKPHNITRHPDMPKEFFKDLWETIKSDKTWHGEIKNRKKNGDYYWVDVVISPVFDKRGKKVGYSSVRMDITDTKKLEELNKTLENRIKKEVEKNRKKDHQLLQQSRLAQMGEMINMIAHQWRQPLAAISSASSSLLVKAKLNKLDNETVEEVSKNINEYSKHLSQTIDDFRTFFKTDKKRDFTQYDKLIENVLSIVKSSLDDKKIEAIVQLEYTKPFKTYANELKQVILNLIKNAEDALIGKKIAKAYIKIRSYEKDNEIFLEISDNAGGIPSNIIDKIFDPYFSTKTKKDGTGLGLYMSKTIIEKHCGGILEVENDINGAVFRIVLKKDVNAKQ